MCLYNSGKHTTNVTINVLHFYAIFCLKTLEGILIFFGFWDFLENNYTFKMEKIQGFNKYPL